MATIVKPYTFSAGATIIAAEHNSNFDTIYNDYNNNITNANISASAAIAGSKINPDFGGQTIQTTGTITGTTLGISGTTTCVTVRATLLTSTTLNISGTTSCVTLTATLTTATTLRVSGTSTLITISPSYFVGLPTYSNNAAASAAGLTLGALYLSTSTERTIQVVNY